MDWIAELVVPVPLTRCHWKSTAFLNKKKLETYRSGRWGSEFSSYEIELWNRVTQNDIKLRVPNSNIFIEILLSSYSKVYLLFFYFRVTNSNLRNNKFHFQLLTQRLNFYFFTFELLTRSWKIKINTSSY